MDNYNSILVCLHNNIHQVYLDGLPVAERHVTSTHGTFVSKRKDYGKMIALLRQAVLAIENAQDTIDDTRIREERKAL